MWVTNSQHNQQNSLCMYNLTSTCRKNYFNLLMNIAVLLTEYCAGGKIEKNEMGGACGAYGAGERGVQVSGGET